MSKDNELHLVIDTADKQDAQDCAADMDISLSDFVRIAVRNEVRHRKLGKLSPVDRYETRARVVQDIGHDRDVAAIVHAIREYEKVRSQ